VELVSIWHPSHGLNRCCALVGLAKSSWYDHKAFANEKPLSSHNQQLKDCLVEIIKNHPAYGRDKLLAEARSRLSQVINHKRVR